jgi:chromosomal replication initiator protein
LRAELGEDVFSSWLARLELDTLGERSAKLSVPTRFLKSWIEAHYLERVLSTYRSELPALESVTVVVRGAMREVCAQRLSEKPRRAFEAGEAVEPAPALDGKLPARPGPDEAGERPGGIAGAPLDHRLTFESFVVGRSNALAHAAGENIARHSGGAPLYNPLFLQAGVGWARPT